MKLAFVICCLAFVIVIQESGASLDMQMKLRQIQDPSKVRPQKVLATKLPDEDEGFDGNNGTATTTRKPKGCVRCPRNCGAYCCDRPPYSTCIQDGSHCYCE